MRRKDKHRKGTYFLGEAVSHLIALIEIISPGCFLQKLKGIINTDEQEILSDLIQGKYRERLMVFIYMLYLEEYTVGKGSKLLE
jgi:hypothetical protein